MNNNTSRLLVQGFTIIISRDMQSSATWTNASHSLQIDASSVVLFALPHSPPLRFHPQLPTENWFIAMRKSKSRPSPCESQSENSLAIDSKQSRRRSERKRAKSCREPRKEQEKIEIFGRIKSIAGNGFTFIIALCLVQARTLPATRFKIVFLRLIP